MKHLALWYIFFTVSLGLVVFASRQTYAMQSAPQMATFTVNSTADAVDANPGDGICATSGGVCTLRAAIQETNALVGVDTIILPAGTYQLTIGGTDEDESATGDLDITENLVINGTNVETTIIDANQLDRALHILATATVTLSDVTIQSGVQSFGGGIFNDGHLYLHNSRLTQNTSSGPANSGGGLYNVGSVTVTNTLLDHNISANNGGAVFTQGPATFIATEFRQNQAVRGGGINHAAVNATELFVESSLFEQNIAASGLGGAFYLDGNNATISFNDTHFQQNTASSWGGAMYLTGLTQTVSIANSHFESNHSTASAGGAIGLYNNTQVATETGLALHITNSNFASNTANSWGGAIHAQGYTITVAITGSEFIENVGSFGGAISLYGPGPTVEIVGITTHITGTAFTGNNSLSGGGALGASTGTFTAVTNAAFINNTTGGSGGAWYIGSDGMTGGAFGRMSNVTLSGNQAALFGGAIYGHTLSTEMRMKNVTIAHNTADSDNNGSGDGGGIAPDNNATFIVANSLIANNMDSGNEAPDCAVVTGLFVSVANNLIGKTDGCTFTPGPDDLTGTIANPLNPHLGPLTGSFPHHPLSLNSPAIDAGYPGPPHPYPADYNCHPTDQIGTTRPIDGNRDGTAVCDIGAIEAPERISTVLEPDIAGMLVYTDTHGNPTTIVVPAGAVTETTTLVFTPIPSVTPPTSLLFAGHALDLEAYINGVLQPGFTFNLPISITITYADEEVNDLNEESLVLLVEEGTQWGDAACGAPETNMTNNMLTTPVCHLSRFALFGNPGEMRVYLPMVLRP